MKCLWEIAEFLEGRLDSSPTEADLRVGSLSSPEELDSDSIAVLGDSKWFSKIQGANASALVIPERLKKEWRNLELQNPPPVIWVKDSYLSMALLSQLFAEDSSLSFGDSFSEIDSPSQSIYPKGVKIFEGARVSANVEIGENTKIYPGVVIGAGVRIGRDCVIFPNTVIYPGCRIGDRVRLQANVVIGSDGFGYASSSSGKEKIVHQGTVEIQDDVEIGAVSAVDRGTFGKTIIGKGVKIDNLCQIGHNVHIGEHTVVCGGSNISGSARIGKHCTLAGMTGVGNGVRLGDYVTTAGLTGVTRSEIPDKAVVAGRPDRPYQEWMKIHAHLGKLPELFKRVRKLERYFKSDGRDEKEI
jgi:UDP-3-O-[3-hydroxymyristoyl] glucosamine N-acyltransferase